MFCQNTARGLVCLDLVPREHPTPPPPPPLSRPAAAAAFLIEDMWGKEVLPLIYTKAYKQHAAHLFPRISSSDSRSITAGVPYPGRPEFKRGDNLEAAAAPSLDNLNRLHSGEAAV